MVRVEHLSHQEEKPLFAQAACVDSLFASKSDTQRFLDILAPAPNNLAHGLEAVLDQAVSAHIKLKMLFDIFPSHDAVEEGIPCLAPHLAFGIMLQNLDLGPDTK